MPIRLTDAQRAAALAAYNRNTATGDLAVETRDVWSRDELPDPGENHVWVLSAIYNMSPMKFQYKKLPKEIELSEGAALPDAPEGYRWALKASIETYPPKDVYRLARNPPRDEDRFVS